MCGIAGIICENEINERILCEANFIQHHRGPDTDSFGIYRMDRFNIGLAHQRLAILDLSALGHQPMKSFNGDSVIIYNGEIYNYKEIRNELELLGYRFRGESDTEVVLTALEHWGPDKALAMFNGMWAFAWLDSKSKKIILARDRFGIKPLYYYEDKGTIYFASEIKTILELSKQRFNLNHQVIGEFLTQSLFDISDSTFFNGIKKLPPSSYCTINLNNISTIMEFKTYWSIGKGSINNYSDHQAIEHTRELLFDSVKLQMRSDVPVGLLLSGGLDSSSIAAAMRYVQGEKSDIFMLSSVSDVPAYDESKYADIVGKHLNAEVHKFKLEIKPQKVFEHLDKVTWFNDEPVGSLSNVAHYLLMEKAKQMGVTVILSGQGADEILCGYRKYIGFYLKQLLKEGKAKTAVDLCYGLVLNQTMQNQFHIGEARRYLPFLDKYRAYDIKGEYLRGYKPAFVGMKHTVQDRQLDDIMHFSVPALTHFEDRMSMAWSREIRVPFLDHRLVEALVPIRMDMKIRNGWTKYILRKAVEPFLPKEIVWRKDKQGFVNPQSQWFKNELRSNVLEYFERDSFIFSKEIVDRQNLLKLYDNYSKQKPGKETVWFRDIFNPLSLELWLRKYEKYIS